MMSSNFRYLVVAFGLIAGAASPAWAYTDPNAAGLIFQILTPILAIAATFYSALRRKAVDSVQWLKARLARITTKAE